MGKRITGIVMLLTIVLGAEAQESGIRFESGNWQEVREKALREGKLIFADFYTEWCGPCLMMAEEIFPLAEVGSFYNTHFVNVKIDAEKGEGSSLREKYGIVSYPAFLFVDPRTEEVVHRSSSRQDAKTFLFTGRSAVTPERRLPYLEKQYLQGNRSRELLAAYMDYLASVYQREKVAQLAEEYTSLPDFSLKKTADWEVFVKHVKGIHSPQFTELMEHKEEYAALYGLKEADQKLYQEFNFSLEPEALEKAPDFQGKDFLLKKNKAEIYLRNKQYEAALPLLEEMMAQPGSWKEEVCQYLKFVARSALYGEHPAGWLKKCAEMAQYVAYNSYNRQEAGIHYDYARILEKLIRALPEGGQHFPESIVTGPRHGVENYSLRPPQLKQKR